MNLWILAEEKPKASVISQIVSLYASDFHALPCKIDDVSIYPIIRDNRFAFTYVVQGLAVEGIKNVFIKIAAGETSFVDFLVFCQEPPPAEDGSELPLMAVEETKTSDKESRNTGVCQRVTKFVYIDEFYPNISKYMLYNEELQADEEVKPSDTNIIGTNILLSLGVKIVGKRNLNWFKPYVKIEEIIKAKNEQRLPSASNVAVRFHKEGDVIYISARLTKPKEAGNIAHDPNIGTVSMLAKGLRVLGWNGQIVITQHGVSQKYMSRRGARNKFIFICKILDMELEGIQLPKQIELPTRYWHYERRSEKVASILLHILGENNGLLEIYQNHAGCERGYFFSKNREQITLPKRASTGEKLSIPDVVMFDIDENTAILIEGKQLSTLKDGIEEIKEYDLIEQEYITRYYPGSITYRYVSIFGGEKKEIPHEDVLFYLSDAGDMYLNENAPKFIRDDFKPTKESYIHYAVIDF